MADAWSEAIDRMLARVFLNLRASYLFAEVKRRTQPHRDAHPGARLIDLGIGDVTRPLPGVVVQALALMDPAYGPSGEGYFRVTAFGSRAGVITRDGGAVT